MYPCRICLIKTEIQINIFDIYQNKFNLQQIIYELCQVEFHLDDLLPTNICEFCASKLVDFHLFREKLLESQKQLAEIQANESENKIEIVFAEPSNIEIDTRKDVKTPSVNDVLSEIEDEEDSEWQNEPTNDSFLATSPEISDTNAEKCKTEAEKLESHKCSKCLKEFPSASKFRDHITQIHSRIGKLKSKRYICKVCKMPFPKSEQFLKHFQRKHLKFDEVDLKDKITDDFVCPWCVIKFATGSSYHRHLRQLHGIVGKINIKRTKPMEPKRKYICEKCDKTYVSPKKFIFHFKQNHMVKEFDEELYCPECSTQFFVKLTLNKHLQSVHGVNSKDELVITSPKIYICEVCEIRLDSRQNFLKHFLQNHLKKEQLDVNIRKVDDFVCPCCSWKTRFPSNFRKHLRKYHDLSDEIHLLVKPAKRYICEQCNEVFTRRLDFLQHFQQKHIQINDRILHESFDKDLVCPICSRQLTTHTKLYIHLKRVHSIIINVDSLQLKNKSGKKLLSQFKEKGQFVCSICSNDYTKLYNLHKHIYDTHTDVNGDICTQSIRNRPDEPASSKMEFKCPECLKIYNNGSSLYRHLRVNHGLDKKRFTARQLNVTGGDINCDKCNQAYADRAKFIKHFQFKHMRLGEEEIKECPFCIKTFSFARNGAYNNMQRHFIKYHSDEDQLSKPEHTFNECPECNEKFADIYEIYQHFKIHDEYNKDDENGYNLECEACKMNLLYLDKYNEHKRDVHGIHDVELVKPFKCNWCGERFRKPGFFHLHLRCVHDENKSQFTESRPRGRPPDIQPKLCTICGKLLSSVSSLSAHLATHTDEENFHCHLCPKKFKTSGGLNSHIRTHIAGRKYTCHLCPKAYKHSSHLKRHFVAHGIGDDCYKCPNCDKQFSKLVVLRAHISTHNSQDD